ncbi:AfsA-related hotdog domain-containing protein [Lentzea aerocolonigenes]|uniref:AfsA-related hotdog domain-containing protein n=1 Tax=Lentzea aerocolonigenes TaxID=68170 RepID=UPI000697CCCD|nr:AfsA-related hotdog domain-containing protein [Lentzea aerocolonigenes]
MAVLDRTRTVDRTLLHRTHLSEVFLTDAVGVDADRYLTAAHLPPSHPYYTDHLLAPGVPDPLLLLECTRQAETYGGHAFREVDLDRKFILLRWTLDLPGLVSSPAGHELTMVTTTSGRKGAGSRIRALTYSTELFLGGHHLGRTVIDVGYQPAESYRYLRSQRRGTPPPMSSAEGLAITTGTPVDPLAVGRGRTDNVLLADVVVAGDELTAGVRAVTTNPSMFDHAQDHLPGMVLVEAARQAGIAVAGATPSALLTGMELECYRYAELDAPLTVHAVRGAWTGIRFEQNGEVIASGSVRLVHS